MKKLLKCLVVAIISIFISLTAGCSVVYSGAACVDKAGRETLACAFEGFACAGDCFNCFSCSEFKDCNHEIYVACPLGCADCVRNNYDDDATMGCMACAEGGFETIINQYHYEYDFDIEYKTTGLPSGYYRAIVTIKVTPSVNLENIICDFTLTNGDASVGATKVYFGTMIKNVEYKKSATFTFKGYGGLNNPKLKTVILSGSYANY
ncbi:MAG: hypothetical protein J6R88_05205 [Clostridia bacterium]|nr:hypothetical protein [Clostridia bacterium]